MITEVEKALQRVQLADPKVPFSISQIPEFPFSDFAKMQEAVLAGTFIIAKFSFLQDPTILSLVAPASRILHLASTAATYLVPLISVILAFSVSHWFWFGLLYFFIGSRFTIKIWTNAIVRAAYLSEPAFCLLFYTSKISAYDPIYSIEYEWQLLTGKN